MTAWNNTSLLFCLCIFYYWLGGLVQGTSLIAKIESASESCLMVRTGEFDAARQRYLEGSFEQIDDRGTDTLIVVIMDDRDTLVYESRHKRSDAFRHRVQPHQTYWLCVQNQPPAEGGDREAQEKKKEKEYDDDDDYYSYGGAGSTARTVGFEYNLVYDETPPTLPPQPGPIPVASYTTIWMNKATVVQQQLRNLQNHHNYMKVREIEHRHVTEQTFTDIMFWTILEGSMVCLLAVGQVLYFRNFLEKKPAARW